MLLATIVLPWFASKHQVVWSWDIISKAPASFLVTLIMLWIIGAAAIALSIFLRGRNAHLCYGLIGMVGVIILLVQLGGRSGVIGRLTPISSGSRGAIDILNIIFFLILIVATRIRLRLPHLLPVRFAQGVCALFFVVFSLMVLINFISHYSDLSTTTRSKFIFDFIFILLLNLALIGAGVVALIHAAVLNIRKDTLSVTAMYLLYLAMAAFYAYLIIRQAIQTERMGLMLPRLNHTLLSVPAMLLFTNGMVGLACGLVASGGFTGGAAAGGKPAAASGGGGQDDVQARLKKLAELQQQGLITEAEYAAKRAKILDQL